MLKLSKEEILRMEAGTDLDYLIAQKIFGLKVSKDRSDNRMIEKDSTFLI